MQVHVVEGADAASQLALLPDLPGDEQGTENDKIQMKLETRVTNEKRRLSQIAFLTILGRLKTNFNIELGQQLCLNS